MIINIFNLKNLEKVLNENEYNRKLLNSCLDRVVNSTLISNNYKNEIRKRGKQLKFIKYPF